MFGRKETFWGEALAITCLMKRKEQRVGARQYCSFEGYCGWAEWCAPAHTCTPSGPVSKRMAQYKQKRAWIMYESYLRNLHKCIKSSIPTNEYTRFIHPLKRANKFLLKFSTPNFRLLTKCQFHKIKLTDFVQLSCKDNYMLLRLLSVLWNHCKNLPFPSCRPTCNIFSPFAENCNFWKFSKISNERNLIPGNLASN